MNRVVGAGCALLLLAGFSSGDANAQAHGWPIQPTNRDHPLGATLGEFQDWGASVYQHTGIDILATPCVNPCAPDDEICVNPCQKPCGNATDDATQPCAVVTVGGTIKTILDVPTSMSNSAEITATHVDAPDIIAVGEERTYRYYHLAYQSFDANFVYAYGLGIKVDGGAPIALVRPWTCNYHHLHYDVSSRTGFPAIGKYLNPLEDIDSEVRPDPLAPQIFAVNLAQHNGPWSVLSPAGAACTVVHGEVDIIAHLLDRDDAGSTLPGVSNVGVYELRWQACPDSAPNCSSLNVSHAFKEMPAAWENLDNAHTLAAFSTTSPWKSDFDECATATVNDTFMVATSAPSATWDTQNGSFPDGGYTVSVRASDIAGNDATQTIHACVQNSPGCATDLMVRDAHDDTGAVPYSGSPFWLSPDITANRGTANENLNINEGVANAVEVQVWNAGSCPIAANTTYNVCLGWNPPSGSVPFPLPTNQVVACRTETVSGSWAPGTNRTTTFNWTPPTGTLPSGHACLAAWSNMTADPVQNTPSVVLDNNRAQRNIAFTKASPPGGMALQPFWINPLDAVSERSIEITFESSAAIPYLGTARVHIPPGVTVAQLSDTRIIGGYRGSAPEATCLDREEERCVSDCNNWEKAAAYGCTLVLGRIGPQSRVRLEGITVRAPTKLLLEVSTSERVPPGAFFDAEIVEYGTIAHSRHTAIGGVTLRFEGSVPR